MYSLVCPHTLGHVCVHTPWTNVVIPRWDNLLSACNSTQPSNANPKEKGKDMSQQKNRWMFPNTHLKQTVHLRDKINLYTALPFVQAYTELHEAWALSGVPALKSFHLLKQCILSLNKLDKAFLYFKGLTSQREKNNSNAQAICDYRAEHTSPDFGILSWWKGQLHTALGSHKIANAL